MPEVNLPVKKSETALSTAVQMPAGLDGVGAMDLLMPRYKIWHPMAKTEVVGARLGDFYEANSAEAIRGSIKFHLLAQKNRSFTQDDGKVKNYKYMLIVREGQYDMPAELVLSGSGIRAVSALNTALLNKSLSDKSQTSFAYLIEAKIEIKENDNGKFGVPKFTILEAVTGDVFDKVAGHHANLAASYPAVQGVDTATAFNEAEVPV